MEQEHKQAVWEKAYYEDCNGEDSYYLAKCSNCGYKEHVFANWYVRSRWHYCPNCGARMDGEREEDGND